MCTSLIAQFALQRLRVLDLLPKGPKGEISHKRSIQLQTLTEHGARIKHPSKAVPAACGHEYKAVMVRGGAGPTCAAGGLSCCLVGGCRPMARMVVAPWARRCG